MRRYTDLTDDGRRIYDGAARAISRVNKRLRALGVGRKGSRSSPEAVRIAAFYDARAALYRLRNELLGKGFWTETGAIVRVGDETRVYRPVPFDYAWTRGEVVLSAFPSDAEALFAELERIAAHAEHDAEESQRAVERDRRATISRRDHLAHWKDPAP